MLLNKRVCHQFLERLLKIYAVIKVEVKMDRAKYGVEYFA